MGCEGIQIQPGCCDCPVAFYDEAPTFFVGPGSCLGNKYDVGIKDNLSLLNGKRLLFLGPEVCNYFPDIDGTQSTAVRDWVQAGGRLFVNAEYLKCLDGLTYPITPNRTAFNNFLGFLGTGIQLATSIPDGCGGCDPANRGVVTDQPIVTALAYGGIANATIGELTGGTALCRITTGFDPPCNDPEICFLAAEYIGDGIVVAASDSNLTYFCDQARFNCEFFRRLCNWKVSEMLTS